MTPEYTLQYFRFGDTLEEHFEAMNDALMRSSELLHRNLGCPKRITRRKVVVYDQEALFNDWLLSLQPRDEHA